MANYQTVVTELMDKLNRDDCTSTLAGYFVNDAVRRVQRQGRFPFMEKSRLVIAQGPLMDWIQVPPDLLEVIDIYVDEPCGGGMYALVHHSMRQIARVPRLARTTSYARLNSTFQFRGAVPKGCGVNVIYYGSLAQLMQPTDTNGLLNVAPDLVVYGALSMAGDHFEHPSAPAWETRFQSILSDIIGQATALEMTGGPLAVQPAYGHLESSSNEW